MHTERPGLSIGRHLRAWSGALLVLTLVAFPAVAGETVPSFFKIFLPDTIGPGSTSTLEFDIFNDNSIPVSDLAFTDDLPAGVVIATPSSAFTDCTDGILSAPDGGSTIAFSGGRLGANSGCIITVNVTSSTVGTHTNESGDLTSSAGNSGPAIADLTVDAARPGFSKSFAPPSVPPLHASTLTLLIDNSANPAAADFLSFFDNLPAGMLVATPANASTDCSSALFPATLTATPGTGVISLNLGTVAAMSICTVTVDVTPSSAGVFVNSTSELLSGFSPAVASGFATAQLDVPSVFLNKIFTDDPVAPGQTVTLDFVITNRDRDSAAANIAFTDDLGAALPGLTAVGLPLIDVCGADSAIFGTTLLSFVNGSLAPDSSCTFSVTLQVPAGAAFGTYTNSTSPVTYDLGGEPVTEEPATDDLIVVPVSLTKAFTDDPVNPDDTVTLEFTIDNSSSTSSLADIAFTDNLSAVIAGLTPVGLPLSDVCGMGSQLTTFVLLDDLFLSMTGGQLAAGQSCTFSVTLQVPAGASPGPYLNTSSPVTALLSGEEPEPVAGRPATDTLMVAGVAAPGFGKVFIDDPVPPGGSVSLEFTITNSDGTESATDLAFTDDLGAVLPGLTAVGLPLTDVCGLGSRLDGTTLLSLIGGTLAPATSCSFAVTLQVPSDASPGTYGNTTSDLTGNVGDLPFTGGPASDDLLISGPLRFGKLFTDDPVAPGGTVTLEFTLTNTSTTDTFNGLEFTDDLEAVIPGLEALGLPLIDVCGAGSQIDGTGFLTFSGGTLAPQTSCAFGVTLQVPAEATPAEYLNTTSQVMDENEAVVAPAATDQLIVANLLTLLKSFTDDPVVPGGIVTLEFNIGYAGQNGDATAITFTDDLDAVIPGLTALGLPLIDVCGPGSQIDGAGFLTFSGGSLAPHTSCAFGVTLQVPASAPFPGSFRNTTSQVTAADVGGTTITGEPATDSLRIAGIPVLAKQFTDDPAGPGGSVTLRFTVTNTNASSQATAIAFSDDLDSVIPGLVATGLPQSDLCGPGSLLDGTSVVTLTGGNLPPGQVCSFDVTLEVPTTAAPGSYPNTTSQLTAEIEGMMVIGNQASDDLLIAPLPLLEKSFIDDPVAGGGTVTLEFTITNTDPGGPATAVAFTDDLDAVLPGLVAVGLPANDVCGAGSQLDGTSLLELTGGNLGAGETCVFSATLQVPAGAAPGSYLNTTSPITAVIGGSTVEGDAATDNLEITPAPMLSKSFTDDPVAAGDTVTLEFSILLQEAADPATEIAFTDDLEAVLPGLVAVGLPINDVCGPGSQLTGTSLLELTGGNLQPGFSCIFAITLQVPAGAASGSYLNTTSELTAQVGGVAVTGAPASDDLEIAGALSAIKEFTDDPVVAGAQVTLEFTLVNSDLSQSVTDIQFTDDLDAALTGLVAVGLPVNDICGAGSQIAGTGLLTLTGGTLAPSASCTFSVTLDVPAGAASGEYPNTTSVVTAVLGNNPVTAAPATDTLTVGEQLALSKSFTDDPAAPGSNVTLEFTVDYLAGVADATDIAFTDDLDAALPGLAAIGLPLDDVCGTGSQISGTSVLSLTGGSLATGTSCTFSVTLQVPASIPPGTYSNLTSEITAMVDGSPISGPPATDDLEVLAGLEFEKLTNGQDADVPPGPILEIGDPVTWEYVLTNTTGEVLTDIVVVDSQGVSVSCPQTTLDPGETLICTGTGIVMPGQYSNVGTASGISGNRQIVVTDPSHYLGVDTTPPTVTNVDSLPDTGDGQLEDCETVQDSIRQLLVSFSEPVQDPPDDVHPDDVTNPANYLLVATGPDNDIQTLVCGAVMGDDVAIPISRVTYDAGTQTATLHPGSILTESLYRLLVCGSTSIRDLAGNALDGNEDGMGGDDYQQIFRTDPANLLANGHFDCSLVDWIVSETIPGAVSHSTEDVDDSSLSGSAEIFNPSQTGNPEAFALAQCVPVRAETGLSVDASTRLDAAPGVFVSFTESCEFFDLAACDGSSLGLALNALLLQDTAGLWISLEGQFMAPVSAASALCVFEYNTPTGEAFDAFLDDTVLDNSPIFADGFESGDTSAWTDSVP